MKFSYQLLKQLVPNLQGKQQVRDALSLHFFDVESINGNIIDINIPANRWSDAASHWGIARELATILNLNLQLPQLKEYKTRSKIIDVKITNKNLCPSYNAALLNNITIKDSPLWMQKILIDCGLKPINNVVDIMNYVMLETGQPLHAFDADKITNKSIVVKTAKNQEKFISLDNKNYILDNTTLVIADDKNSLAIAGIKGGKKAEIDNNTKSIIVESANFDSVSIYKTSQKIKLITDASLRFAHNLHPILADIGIARAIQLLKEIIGANLVSINKNTFYKFSKKVLRFNQDEFSHLIGLNVDIKIAAQIFQKLGFKILSKDSNNLILEIPPLRTDIENNNDLFDEIIRVVGYDKLPSTAPVITLKTHESDDLILFKRKVRKILNNFGLDEVYTYSFIGDDDVEKYKISTPLKLLNYISSDKKYLRPSLIPNLSKSVKQNLRFFDRVNIFEIGNIFNKDYTEKWSLGIALSGDEKSFFELKGILEALFSNFGLTDFYFAEKSNYDLLVNSLSIIVDEREIGYIGQDKVYSDIVVGELDFKKLLDLIEGDLEYKELPKYPAVERDVSIVVGDDVKVGNIIDAIQSTNIKLIENVDLIDEYTDKNWINKQGLTFRIVFRSPKKTLTALEVDNCMNKIINVLQKNFQAEIR
ncbi:MAG: phenylalanine--tRNA ligase subunit beta [Minisyncoccia bacterium]